MVVQCGIFDPERCGLPRADRRARRLFCLSLLVSFLCGAPVTGRLSAQIVGSTVSGTVTDPASASVPQAKVVLRNTATQIVRNLSVNVGGFYSAPNLAPGEYIVTVS